MHLNTNTLALATCQIREIDDDDQTRDRRIIAIGLVHASVAADGKSNLHIDAIACAPGRPSRACASELADWILAQTHEPLQVLAWGLSDPLICGLSDIAAKVEARVARDLSKRFSTWKLLV
ncbi:MAG: hypothetical protein EOO81_11640 [Oxalobacteraceae bacterium]|nr:MAG: hypothetical protein EOO81_11640 [Oxalobacteraceae bacterium]